MLSLRVKRLVNVYEYMQRKLQNKNEARARRITLLSLNGVM